MSSYFETDVPLSDIVAEAEYAFIDQYGKIGFTHDADRAGRYWHCRVAPGERVPRTLPLEPPTRARRGGPTVTEKDRARYDREARTVATLPTRDREHYQHLFNTSSDAVEAFLAGGHVLVLGTNMQMRNWAYNMGLNPIAAGERRRLHAGTDPDSLRGIRGPVAIVDLGVQWTPDFTEAMRNVELANMMPYAERTMEVPEALVSTEAPKATVTEKRLMSTWAAAVAAVAAFLSGFFFGGVFW